MCSMFFTRDGLHNDPVNLLEERSDESQVQPDVQVSRYYERNDRLARCWQIDGMVAQFKQPP